MLSMFSDLADTQEGASNPLEVRKRKDKIRMDKDKNGNWRDIAVSQVFEDADSIPITHWGKARRGRYGAAHLYAQSCGSGDRKIPGMSSQSN